mmetsp:Transcript_777/g.1327  ORF Transcript_777/g.1327 Transcript_777/m.1327 type:complete len:286 (-) Transcript_777:18-875(-)
MSSWDDACQHGVQNGDEYADGLDLRSLAILSNVIGWIYFVAWSISFYPQVILNFRRKSVVGYSFDYCYLNILGFTAYSVFNCVLFWSHSAQVEYCDEHGPPNPVHANDVFFAVHGFVLCCVLCVQCFIYDRGAQYVGWVGVGFGIPLWIFTFICLNLWVNKVITILQFIDWIAYVKLIVSFVKYCPQAYFNYKRKSTVGWSIIAIFLDLTGGVLSLLQGVIDWINSGNVKLFLGDPVKFGLSIISIVFDVIFLVQHYILYPQKGAMFDKIEEEEEDQEELSINKI